MRLEEIMGDLTRGDGRKLYNTKKGYTFEPIFISRGGFWFGLLDSGLESYSNEGEDGWEFITGKIKVVSEVRLDMIPARCGFVYIGRKKIAGVEWEKVEAGIKCKKLLQKIGVDLVASKNEVWLMPGERFLVLQLAKDYLEKEQPENLELLEYAVTGQKGE